ncbi:hypothetical protein Tco_0283551 [Tanacetum coccineum]
MSQAKEAQIKLYETREDKELDKVIALENKVKVLNDIVYNPGPQCSTTVLEQDSLSPGLQSQENVPQVAEIVTTSNELGLLYSLMFSE